MNLLEVHQAEASGSNLDLHHFLVLLLEWEEVWLVAVCHHKVVITFDNGEMKQDGSHLTEYCPHQAVAIPWVDFVQASIQVPGKFSHHDLQLPTTQISEGMEAVWTGAVQKRMLYLHLKCH